MEYFLNTKDTLKQIGNTSALIIPKKLYYELKENYNNYICLGLTEDKEIHFKGLFRTPSSMVILYNSSNTSSRFIVLEEIKGNYIINLKYANIDSIIWFPKNKIKTLIFKNLKSEEELIKL